MGCAEQIKGVWGLGFVDTRAISRWISITESEDESPCIQLLRKKYLGDGGFFQKSTRNSSQFWQGLLKAKEWYQFGRSIRVGNGKTTRFWLDVWAGKCSFKKCVPKTVWHLFRIANFG